MALRSARLTGDPLLESCLAGGHKMLAGEDNLSVMRLQSALLELGQPVGASGADGIFGPDTGQAVSDYKTSKGLVPNDPVVGSGTAKALDDDLLIEPPAADPTFAEFSPAVVDHRLEQFVALELSAFLRAPLDSWRHMLGRFALAGLNSGMLLGIVAQSRALDLQAPFHAVADPVQPNGATADTFFDDAVILGDALARTDIFTAGGVPRAFITIQDAVVRGRAVITRIALGTHAPATLQGTVVHELTHARNIAGTLALLATADTDSAAFADTALAQSRTTLTGLRTAEGLRSFVGELTARHVHWVLLQELNGTPGSLAVASLPADRLAAAADLYFTEFRTLYDRNDYGAGIAAQGGALRLRQLELWLRACAAISFSDVAAEDAQSRLAFEAAADLCASRIGLGSLPPAPPDGVFPVAADFK